VGISLNKDRLACLKEIGSDLVESLDFGHSGVETLSNEPQGIPSLNPVIDG
jgi:hypothetical protein